MVNSFNRGDSFTIRTCDKINQLRQRLGGNLCVLGNPRVYTQRNDRCSEKLGIFTLGVRAELWRAWVRACARVLVWIDGGI